MSLIKPQNLAGPFTNRVHLFTILIVAVLFGVFRLAGGTVKSVPTGVSEVPANRVQAAPLDDGMDPRREIQRLGRGGQDELMDGLVENKKPAATPASSKPAGPAGLDDIEKSLGIR
jgi:hypothetical protein